MYVLAFTVWWTTAKLTPPAAFLGPLVQSALLVAQPAVAQSDRGRMVGLVSAAPAAGVWSGVLEPEPRLGSSYRMASTVRIAS